MNGVQRHYGIQSCRWTANYSAQLLPGATWQTVYKADINQQGA